MTIENRLADAILDLQGALLDGACTDDAIDTVAATYGLKPFVLRERAIKALGPLENVGERLAAEAARARDAYVSKSAINEYANTDTEEPAFAWLTKKLGRAPTHEEQRDALGMSMERWLARHIDDFRK